MSFLSPAGGVFTFDFTVGAPPVSTGHFDAEAMTLAQVAQAASADAPEYHQLLSGSLSHHVRGARLEDPLFETAHLMAFLHDTVDPFINGSERRNPGRSLTLVQEMDQQLGPFQLRDHFHFPHHQVADKDPKKRIHLVGNSLGPLYLPAASRVLRELYRHAVQGDDGHYPHKNAPHDDWLSISEWQPYIGYLAELLGCQSSECAPMGQLTIDANILLQAFITHQFHTRGPKKVLILDDEFPSDIDAVHGQMKMASQIFNSALRVYAPDAPGLNPEEMVVRISTQSPDGFTNTDDVIRAIEAMGDDIGIVWMSAINFQSGHFYDVQRIAEAVHQRGGLIGLNLAHALGNVPLKLSEWGIDFAAFCSYKYLNAGPGGMGGIFVAARHQQIAHAQGWFGRTVQNRFHIGAPRVDEPDTRQWIQSNPNVLALTAFYANLVPFHRVGIHNLRQISLRLTRYLELLLKEKLGDKIRVINEDPDRRGAQLTIHFNSDSVSLTAPAIEEKLRELGVASDSRGPQILRIAPAPLYNNFGDIFAAVQFLERVL